MGNITIQELAKSHHVKLPKKRKPSVEVLVRALVIEKLKAEDSKTSKNYEDKKTGTKWLLLTAFTTLPNNKSTHEDSGWGSSDHALIRQG